MILQFLGEVEMSSLCSKLGMAVARGSSLDSGSKFCAFAKRSPNLGFSDIGQRQGEANH